VIMIAPLQLAIAKSVENTFACKHLAITTKRRGCQNSAPVGFSVMDAILERGRIEE
jgi:hypothetical protein